MLVGAMYSTTLTLVLSCAFAPFFHRVAADSHTKNFHQGDDLHRFISRPDLMPPKFDIRISDRERTSPGYWFLAPYSDLRERKPSHLYTPGQVGPHIYDGLGNLVWSGAHLFEDRSTFDFKPSIVEGLPGLTFIVNHGPQHNFLPRGAGIVLSNSYRITDKVVDTVGQGLFNMHEFTITENNTALMVTYDPTMADVTHHFDDDLTGEKKDNGEIRAMVGNNGFQEVDLQSGKTIFEWWALDHLQPSDSLVKRPQIVNGGFEKPWDFFHLNSIDKDKEQGDYLISSRFLNAVFKISGTDGSVMWQLGGKRSSFTFEPGFNFSSQHDARWRERNSTHEIISIFNNAADDHKATAAASSAMNIALDLTSMRATLLEQLERPDQTLTRLRGNVQHLENGNKFVCWSENGHISEFDPTGQLVLDATFVSRRFVTYRGYKFNFTGAPSEAIATKALVYGASRQRSTTAIYVSWNGATEVASWRFYETQRNVGSQPRLLGQLDKSGFETVLMVPGTRCSTYVEALSLNGTVIGTSKESRSEMPDSWNSTACELLEGPTMTEDLQQQPPAVFLSFERLQFSVGTLLGLGLCGFLLVAALALSVLKIRSLKRLLDDRPRWAGEESKFLLPMTER